MLTDKDIDKLMNVFPTKDEVGRIVDEKLTPVIETQQKLLTGMDRLATAIETQNLENAVRDTQLTRHNGWIHKIAKETKVKLAN